MTELEQRVLDRCVEEGQCWIWKGAISGGNRGGPCVNWGGKTLRVRRMLWIEGHGPIRDGWVVSATCGNKLCVSPACAVCVTNRKSKKMAAARGAYSSAARTAQRILAARARSWITEEMVQEVKAARTAKEAHEATGVSMSWAKQIRRGVGRADHSNPFAGLGR